jgi:CHAT domain-containing protein
MNEDPEVTPELVDRLLALQTREEQTELLRAEGLLNADGLDRLLDVADDLLGRDPGKARQLAELCIELADKAKALAVVPHANYVLAGVHSLNGEFEEDLRLTKRAHDQYLALGMHFEALRTNVGKMAALLELGRYQEALEAGSFVLSSLQVRNGLRSEVTQEQVDLLSAFVYHNQGGCYEYMGRYEKALNAWEQAEKKYRILDMAEQVGEIMVNKGAVLLYLGRGTEALSTQEAAAAVLEHNKLIVPFTKAIVNIGEIHLRLGNYAHSLSAFEAARPTLETLNTLSDKYLLLRHTADAYLELNLYSEALALYQEAIDSLRKSGMAHDLAQALWGKGSALISMSKFEDAEETLTEAAEVFADAGNLPQLSGVMLEQASVQSMRGDRDGALVTAMHALDLIAQNDWPTHSIYAHLQLAILQTDLTTAETHLLAARKLVNHLALPQLRYRLNERFGQLRRLQGRSKEALSLLESAIEEIERLRGTVPQETMRASFLRNKTIAYEELLQLHLDQDDEENLCRALSVAERAKSRALVDLLTGVVEPRLAPNDPELDARLRELQADLNATYGQMLSGSMDGESRVPLSELQARAASLEQEISRLRLRSAATDSTTDVFESPLRVESIEDRLPSDVTLLAYHVIGDEVMAFVNARGQLHAVRHVGSVEKVRHLLQRLAAQWDRFRVGGDFASKHMALLERSARQVLAALHKELVAPLEPLLEGVGRISRDEGSPAKLAVVPHGPLHQVPFHALFDGERYLIERFEVSYAPSATVFALCQERERRGSGKAAVFGVEDPLVPATVGEARTVAEHLPGAAIRVGEAATVTALRKAAPGCDVLHLASHGMFRADNPMFSALKLHDGWLMASDVMELDLDGALVVLSACESGRSEVIGGDEILGLARAFLGAGAASLVVSLWLVQDETTAKLMERWYARLREGVSRVAALHAAQLEIKKEHPHPYYWAPFVLMGKR